VFGDWTDPRLVMKKIQRNVSKTREVIPGALLFMGVYMWGNWKFDQEQKKNRY